MARATIDDDLIVLQAEWREKERCKQIPGARYDNNRGAWTYPLSWATCITLRGVFDEELVIADELNQWAAHEVRTRITPTMALRHATSTDEDVYSGPDGFELEPLQKVGVAFLKTAGRALLGDGLGAGKTIQTICAIETLNDDADTSPFPVLIVCTKTMMHTWKHEIGLWAPHRTVEVIEGSKAKRVKLIESAPDFTIINWESLVSHTKLAPFGNTTSTDKDKEPKELNVNSFGTVVADEAHRAKNPKAKQTRAWWQVSHDASYSFALTGTPLNRSPDQTWSIMHGIHPKEFRSKTAFIDRYCEKKWNMFGGLDVTGLNSATQDELFKFLDPRFIRRPTNVVIPDIADKLAPQFRYIEMSPKQAKAYKQMKDEMIAILDDDVLYTDSSLAKMTRLLQLASAYLEINEDGSVQMTDPSSKIDGMMDVIDELDDDPIVIFCVHTQLTNLACKRLDKEGIPYGRIEGDVSPLERTEAVQRFQAGQFPVMVCSIAAGSEGITLTRARHILFLQRAASFIQNTQAEGRVWRKGQDRPVQPIYLCSRDTIDEEMIEIGNSREVTFEQVVRDKETVRKMLGVEN